MANHLDSLIFLESKDRACVLFQIFISASDGFARNLLHLLKQAAKCAGELAAFSRCVFGVAKIAAGKTVMSLIKSSFRRQDPNAGDLVR